MREPDPGSKLAEVASELCETKARAAREQCFAQALMTRRAAVRQPRVPTQLKVKKPKKLELLTERCLPERVLARKQQTVGLREQPGRWPQTSRRAMKLLGLLVVWTKNNSHLRQSLRVRAESGTEVLLERQWPHSRLQGAR